MSELREQDGITSVITWVWQKKQHSTPSPPIHWISAKQYIKIKVEKGKGTTKYNTQRDPEPETQDPILIDSHGVVLDQRNTLRIEEF